MRPSAARLVLISDLPVPPEFDHAIPQLVRLAGRVVGWDPANNKLLLADYGAGIVVDLTIAVGTAASNYAEQMGSTHRPELKDLIMITGDLELSKTTSTLKAATGHSQPRIDPRYVLVAQVIKPCEELVMQQWRQAVLAIAEAS